MDPSLHKDILKIQFYNCTDVAVAQAAFIILYPLAYLFLLILREVKFFFRGLLKKSGGRCTQEHVALTHWAPQGASRHQKPRVQPLEVSSVLARVQEETELFALLGGVL